MSVKQKYEGACELPSSLVVEPIWLASWQCFSWTGKWDQRWARLFVFNWSFWFYPSVTSFRVATLPRQRGTLIHLDLVLQNSPQSVTWVRRFPSNSRISSLRKTERWHHWSSKMFQIEKPFVLANSVREGDQEVVPLTFDQFWCRHQSPMTRRI